MRFKPEALMAFVLTLFSISVNAQSSSDKGILCYIGADNAAHPVNMYVTQSKPFNITCNYENGTASIPKFFQFSCNGGASLLSVQISITDGVHAQVLNKDVQVNETDELYEVPVLAYVNEEIMQSGKAHITSIKFTNNMNLGVHLAEVNFSNISANYEIKMSQVFTVDMREPLLKNYFMYASTAQTVSINLYKTTGELEQKILKELVRGENYLKFSELGVPQDDKYVIVISEYDIKKAPSSRITVMN